MGIEAPTTKPPHRFERRMGAFFGTFMLQILLSPGIWFVIFSVTGVFVASADHAGYHSTSADTTFLPLSTVLLVVMAFRVFQSFPLSYLARRTRSVVALAVAAAESIVWLGVVRDSYGNDTGEWLTYGYGVLFQIFLVSNGVFVLGLLFGHFWDALRVREKGAPSS